MKKFTIILLLTLLGYVHGGEEDDFPLPPKNLVDGTLIFHIGEGQQQDAPYGSSSWKPIPYYGVVNHLTVHFKKKREIITRPEFYIKENRAIIQQTAGFNAPFRLKCRYHLLPKSPIYEFNAQDYMDDEDGCFYLTLYLFFFSSDGGMAYGYMWLSGQCFYFKDIRFEFKHE